MLETEAYRPHNHSRALKCFQAVERRRELLNERHIKPLAEFAVGLRDMGRGEVPDFDPWDGGVNARALFLFEKPGPMTSASGNGNRSGSGFISRDNDDQTAEATRRFMMKANFPRELTVLWNAVPWWNGTRKVTSEELTDGVAQLDRLTTLLPRLSAVVFVGKKAAKAGPLFSSSKIALYYSAHPSPLVRASAPNQWNAIADVWATVAKQLN